MSEVPQDPHETQPHLDAAIVEPNKDARLWAMLCHITALTMWFSGIGMFLGPFICWLVKKDEFPFVNDQGKEALNFQITMLLWFIGSVILTIVTCGILFPLIFAVFIVDTVLAIMAGLKANEGVAYHYPLTLRLIK